LNISEIKYIHEFLVLYFHDKEDPVSPPGIKNEGILESSVQRPFMSVGGQDAYKGVFNKGAALFHSLINNHCFHNGNKRAALLSTLSFLGENGYWVTVPTDDEMFEFTRQSAAHELCDSRDDELALISQWFKSNSRRRQNGENMLKVHELRNILSGFGYEFGSNGNNNNYIDLIKDGVVVTKIIKKGSRGKEDYDKQYIQRLRKKLKLTSAYGVDSYAFYGDRGFSQTLGKFMTMRHKVMRELAKI
jgi:death-on-curing protein